MKILLATALAALAAVAHADPGKVASFSCGGDDYAILSDGHGYVLARLANGGRRLATTPIPASAAPNPAGLCREVSEICATDRITRVAALDRPTSGCMIGLAEMGALD